MAVSNLLRKLWVEKWNLHNKSLTPLNLFQCPKRSLKSKLIWDKFLTPRTPLRLREEPESSSMITKVERVMKLLASLKKYNMSKLVNLEWMEVPKHTSPLPLSTLSEEIWLACKVTPSTQARSKSSSKTFTKTSTKARWRHQPSLINQQFIKISTQHLTKLLRPAMFNPQVSQ